MSLKQGKSIGALVSGALVGALVAVVSCSSSSGSNSSGDDGGGGASSSGSGGGSGSSGGAVIHPDGAATGSSGGSSSSGGGSTSGSGSSSGTSGSSSSSGAGSDAATGMYDGTVGKACASNADCQPAGGPGVNVCSNTAFTQPLWPTPICVIQSCDPLDPTGNGALQFCDGSPTDQTAPGICIPTTSPIQKGMGVCLPQCQFQGTGAAPSGCQGKDTCYAAAFGTNTSGSLFGIGYCFGGCAADADCPTGSKCQVDQGLCLKALYTRTKTLGQACTMTDATSNACNCDYNTTSNQGVCTQSCTVGGGPACPTGWACDSGLTSTISGGAADGGDIPGFTKQNSGLGGICRKTCTTPGDAGGGGGDGGGQCPSTTTCQSGETVGLSCIP